MLCRTLNTILSLPLLRRIAPTPGVGDRSDTLAFLETFVDQGSSFLEEFAPLQQTGGLKVLDVGCGLGGKTVALSVSDAGEVVGIDSDLEKTGWAQILADRRANNNVFFAVQTASDLAFSEATFDLVLLLDVIEHVDDPLAVLLECGRVLRPGGRVLIGFPPYRSPWGAHLFGHIRIPWAHLLFSDREIVNLWRQLHLQQTADRGAYCTELRERCIMTATTVAELWDLNGMTIRRFLNLVQETPLSTTMLRFKTPGNLGSLFTRSKVLREYVVTRLVAVLEK
jgi:2-polyprenyl-3-methyl-5-hydroxy-6-metoxy-1,4-benzoquinol methylase